MRSRRSKPVAVVSRKKVIDIEQRNRELESGLPQAIFSELCNRLVVDPNDPKKLASFLGRWGSWSIRLGKPKNGRWDLSVSFTRRKVGEQEYVFGLVPTYSKQSDPAFRLWCENISEEITELKKEFEARASLSHFFADKVFDILTVSLEASPLERSSFKDRFVDLRSWTFSGRGGTWHFSRGSQWYVSPYHVKPMPLSQEIKEAWQNAQFNLNELEKQTLRAMFMDRMDIERRDSH